MTILVTSMHVWVATRWRGKEFFVLMGVLSLFACGLLVAPNTFHAESVIIHFVIGVKTRNNIRHAPEQIAIRSYFASNLIATMMFFTVEAKIVIFHIVIIVTR
jgi:hypothetical protein